MTRLILLLCLAVATACASFAQTISRSTVQIEWKVANRFPFFRNEADFRQLESAWRQYGIHVAGQPLNASEKRALMLRSSVIGAEHVLNDRYIAFTRHLREKYDWRGWAANVKDATCWDAGKRQHSACGGVEAYVNPQAFEIDAQLRLLQPNEFISEYNCQWQVDENPAVTVPCDEPARLQLTARGGTLSVSVNGAPPISLDAQVNSRLIVGLGDSFASGEGNPDKPAAISGTRRFRNVYPARETNDGSSDAQWLDEKCHRSLYSYQLRAALQMALEDEHASIAFLGYACSGAAIEEGILGPQSYMQYKSRDTGGSDPSINRQSGNKREAQFAMLLAELCKVKPERDNGLWICPGRQFRRNIDYLLLSIGGNDIGFSNLVTWATLQQGASSTLAKAFGASMPPKTVAANIAGVLPRAYIKLAGAFEKALPLTDGALPFDSARVILSAYPDILENEQGAVCAAQTANLSLNVQSDWLAFDDRRLARAHEQLAALHASMANLAGDMGWTFAAAAYEAKAFAGRGFCAIAAANGQATTEQLEIPCWGVDADCASNWRGKEGAWRPFDPQTESFPYAMRQRWVRTFNDVFLLINEKVHNVQGQIDERASAAVFSETTGAMHPTAEGHAAMADAVMEKLR